MSFASSLPLAAACLVLLPGCGARSDLEVSPAPTAASCGGPAPSGPFPQCAAWQPAGPLVTLFQAETPGGQMFYLTSVIPSAGRALIAWFPLDDTPTSTWITLAVDFDGTLRSSIAGHLSFPTMGGVDTGSMSLAGKGCSFAGLVDDVANGCRFLPLDENGNETGPAVSVEGTTLGCGALGTAQGGYSFLSTSGSGTGPPDLVSLSAAGSVLATVPLPQAELAEGGRLVLRDESFLLSTFEEGDAGGNIAAVQHFSPGGAPIASAAQITDAAESILPMVETSGGVTVEWLGFGPAGGDAMFLRSLDTDGHPVAEAVPVAATSGEDIYGFALAGTPGGDVLLPWFDLDEPTSTYNLHVLALGPDGAPRGAPTPLGNFETLGDLLALVAPDGRRALLVMTGVEADPNYGLLALPLACAM